MKIALYIEDGLEQIVLTPMTDTERSILGKLAEQGRRLQIKRGGFYECVGGYVRQAKRDESSTIIVLREPEKGHAEPGADITTSETT